MLNDANFLLRARMVRDENPSRHDFAIDKTVRYDLSICLFSFLPRKIKNFRRRAKRFVDRQ